jgi:hypothetical protein
MSRIGNDSRRRTAKERKKKIEEEDGLLGQNRQKVTPLLV